MATSTPIVAGPPKKIPWTATGSGLGGGGLLGLFIGGPVAGLVTGVMGAAVGYFFGAKLAAEAKTLIPPSALQVLSGGTPAAEPHLATVAQVVSSGVAKAAAAALYAYLKVHGADGTSDLAQLVSTFQSQSNSDPNALQLTGPLPVSAVYDVKTSAALTMYTNDPIPPATPPAPQPPPSPAQVADIYLPGAAATSGYNLYAYLKAHGNSPSDLNLQRLVHQFQIDVDTDPKFPGPAATVGAGIIKILVTAPLPQNGIYDTATANALTVMSGSAINP